MTSYNIAVTVCPVIFRPRIQQADEITRVSTFYDTFIRMIDNYHYLFDADDRFCNQVNPVPRPSQESNGVMGIASGSIGAIGTKLVLSEVFGTNIRDAE